MTTRLEAMLTAPTSYSPSSLSQFTSCPLAFRFSYIERRPSPPQIAATKGSIVHRGLELLYLRTDKDRTLEAAHTDLDTAFSEFSSHPDLVDLALDEDDHNNLVHTCHGLIDKYFELENPQSITPVGLEVKLQTSLGSTLIRGIIDRLERDNEGNLVVTDYKTGSAPRQASEQSRLSGVFLYALLCEKIFGVLPDRVQLLYLAEPVAIVATPSPGVLKGIENKSLAINTAVERACEKNDFRPNPSALCGWCGYRDLCPAQGGVLPDEID